MSRPIATAHHAAAQSAVTRASSAATNPSQQKHGGEVFAGEKDEPQVPAGHQQAEDETGAQRRSASLQTGQGEAAPARLLAQRAVERVGRLGASPRLDVASAAVSVTRVAGDHAASGDRLSFQSRKASNSAETSGWVSSAAVAPTTSSVVRICPR